MFVHCLLSPRSRIPVTELADGEILSCEGATLRVLHTPGHANDHVCLFLEEERAMFTGDNVLGWGTGTFQDLQQYMRSLKLMASQAPDVLYPAHGPVVSGTSEVAAWLQMYITHREDRIRQVENELRAVDVGLDLVDLVKRVYKAQPEVLQSEGLFRGACLNTKENWIQPGFVCQKPF
ncbi:LACTB2 [Symbiodinium necroappetens]|uniref:LACTB2 protein n=1 Tax=Symbiodinium necroappetens TaxID=1628268 RepID=A0A812QKI2_9DINO|nr:LACTB2 [Symbiodinium necroappetens]